jgi:hypothetical protein
MRLSLVLLFAFFASATAAGTPKQSVADPNKGGAASKGVSESRRRTKAAQEARRRMQAAK